MILDYLVGPNVTTSILKEGDLTTEEERNVIDEARGYTAGFSRWRMGPRTNKCKECSSRS